MVFIWVYSVVAVCCLNYNEIILSLKQPSECNTYADIDAVYKCLKEQYEVKDEQLIIYGQSVGSGPTVDLASRVPNLRGVVLHSPILSGVRVLYPVKRTYWFDIYKVKHSQWLSVRNAFPSPLVKSDSITPINFRTLTRLVQ